MALHVSSKMQRGEANMTGTSQGWKYLDTSHTQVLKYAFTPIWLCNSAVSSARLSPPCQLFTAPLASADGERPYQFKAASSVKKDVVAFADSKVMGDKQGVLQAKLLACHPSPLLIKLSHINGHLQSTWLHLTAATHTHSMVGMFALALHMFGPLHAFSPFCTDTRIGPTRLSGMPKKPLACHLPPSPPPSGLPPLL